MPESDAARAIREMGREIADYFEAAAQRISTPFVAPDILERLQNVESRVTEIERHLNLPPTA